MISSAAEIALNRLCEDRGVLQVRLSIPGAPENCGVSQFVGNQSNRWGDCEFFINTNILEPDLWVVCEDLNDRVESAWIDPRRVVYVSAETSWESNFFRSTSRNVSFINQFEHVFTPHDIYGANATAALPFLPWMINGNHGASYWAETPRDLKFLRDLPRPQKTRGVSVICSSQTMTPEHRMRLAFVESLKSHFKDKLDWFGNGINPTPDKWEALEPYRYTITLENRQADNVITEKLYDAFLAYCFPLYWGAPNAHAYFNSSGFSHLNIRDLNGSIRVIEEALDSKIAEQAIDAISDNRHRVLNELNMFARLNAIAVDVVQASRNHSRFVTLTSRRDGQPSRWRGGPRDVSGRAIEKLGRLIRR